MAQATLDPLNTNSLSGNSSRRKSTAAIIWVLASLCLVAIVGPAIWIIGSVFGKMIKGWRWSVLAEVGVGLGGGLLNEIIGTLMIVAGVAIMAGSMGILSGFFLSEYGDGPLGGVLRTASEVLAGVPSIVLGYVGYVALVVHFHWGYSLGAGIMVLTVMVVPYISKTTEISLKQVPISYKEGAEALGMKNSQVLRRIVLKTALPGITTGMIIATAIAVGETAPLLYTAGYSQSLPALSFTHHPVGYLTYAVWNFYNQPSLKAQQLSFDAAGILIIAVILLIVLSRLIVAMTQKHSEFR